MEGHVCTYFKIRLKGCLVFCVCVYKPKSVNVIILLVFSRRAIISLCAEIAFSLVLILAGRPSKFYPPWLRLVILFLLIQRQVLAQSA